MKKPALLAITLGFIFLAAAIGYCVETLQKAEEAPPKVEEAPPKAEEAPQKAEEAPPKVEEAPPKVEEAPPKVEEAPQKIDLSLADAIAMAIRKNVDLKVEVLNTSIAEAEAAGSRGIYDPQFNTTANGGVVSVPGDPFFDTESWAALTGLTQTLPTGGSVAATVQSGFTNVNIDTPGASSTTWQSALGVTVTQPLLKNAGKETTEINITLAANALKDSQERFRFTATDTVLAVIISFNRIYTLQQSLESKVTALNSAQALLDELNKREKPSPLQVMEIANAEFALTQRRKDLVDAERSLRDHEALFRYLIGMESKNQINPTDLPFREEPPETEAQAVKMAMELRDDLKQLRLALEANQLQERVARHQTLPELTISGGGGINGSNDSIDGSFRQMTEHPGTFWQAGLQFIVPLGNTTAENDYRKSKIRTEQAQNQINALSWRIRTEVESDMRSLISARLQIQITEKSLEFAAQRLDEYRKNSRLGTATIQDLINAENDYLFARIAQIEAIEAFSNGVAKLRRDTGVLLYRHGVHIKTSGSDSLMASKK